jgi:hypothetical protein
MTSHQLWIRRLEELKRRARVRSRGPIPHFDLGEWPLELQLAYREASESTRQAMLETHFGPLPVPEPGYEGEVLCVVIVPYPYPRPDRHIEPE